MNNRTLLILGGIYVAWVALDTRNRVDDLANTVDRLTDVVQSQQAILEALSLIGKHKSA